MNMDIRLQRYIDRRDAFTLLEEGIITKEESDYPAFSAGKMNLSELARVCDLSRPTVYKYLKLIA